MTSESKIRLAANCLFIYGIGSLLFVDSLGFSISKISSSGFFPFIAIWTPFVLAAFLFFRFGKPFQKLNSWLYIITIIFVSFRLLRALVAAIGILFVTPGPTETIQEIQKMKFVTEISYLFFIILLVAILVLLRKNDVQNEFYGRGK